MERMRQRMQQWTHPMQQWIEWMPHSSEARPDDAMPTSDVPGQALQLLRSRTTPTSKRDAGSDSISRPEPGLSHQVPARVR
jgi:hypothetical protein